MQRNIEKILFVSEIIPSEKIAIICVCSEYNTCHQQLIGQQTVLRSCIPLRETFIN